MTSRRILRHSGISAVLLAAAALLHAAAPRPRNGAKILPNGDVRIEGPGLRPQLFFACDSDTGALESLLADRTVITQLENLHAGIALATKDLSPSRAQIVERLDEAGIPMIAWLTLPADQGYYLNAGDAQEAAARFAAFERWTAEYNLRWSGIGLDIEPSLRLFAALKNHPLRVIPSLLWRSFEWARVRRARESYSELIRQMHSAGYPVQTYQFVFLADERKVHSTLLERAFGIVDVNPAAGSLSPRVGSEDAGAPLGESAEALMIYTTFNHQAGAALILSYGGEAQAIAIGSTLSSGNPALDRQFPPLDWKEFSRDLIVATHFSRLIGVYNLEGCVRQGFLSRLKTLDWNQSVIIPAASIRHVTRFRHAVEGVLWLLSHFLYFVVAIVLGVALLLWRRRSRRRRAQSDPAAISLSEANPAQSRWQRVGPIVTLLLLSPFIAELLSAATRTSVLYVLIPEIMTWGCGALIIRELVRRWQGGQTSLLLLAPAIAIAEEIVIQQTSLAPFVWVHSTHIYGRFLGANWVWFLAMLVYESVTVVLLPVQLTELAFRGRRNERWLPARGLLIAAAVFLFGAFLAWFAWTQNYRTKILHLPAYHPAAGYLVLGLATIALLAFAAYRQRKSAASPRRVVKRRVSPTLVGIAALALAYPWDFMIALNFNIAPNLPGWIPLVGGTAYVVALFLVVRHLSSASTWNDLHRFALCAGAAAAVAVWGIENVWHGPRIDLIGELAFLAIAILLSVGLGRALAARPAPAAGDAGEN